MKRKQRLNRAGTGIFTFISIFYVLPIVVVFFNSFKKSPTSTWSPSSCPTATPLPAWTTTTTAIDQYGFLKAVAGRCLSPWARCWPF